MLNKILYLFILVTFFNCDYDSGNGGTDSTSNPTSCSEVTGEATFSEVYVIINQTSGKGCVNASCHGGTRTPRMDQSEAQAKVNIVGVKDLNQTRTYITANSLDSSQSLLYNKLSSSSPAVGVQMPKSGTKWESSDILTLARWICSGAE
jgi:hypothetical protein